MPLEVGPRLSIGASSFTQLKNGRYLQQRDGTAVTGNSPTMLSGCQLNHMLPTLTDQLELIREPSSGQMGQVS